MLRFTTDMLRLNLPTVMQTVTDTVNRFGGVMEPPPPYTPRYLDNPDKGQGRLFG